MSEAPPSGQPGSLKAVLEKALQRASAQQVSIEDVVVAFGPTSFVPLLLVPALAVTSPLSGIPLFSSVCGVMIALIALQQLLGMERVWLPQWILRRTISGRRLSAALEKMRPLVEWLDRQSRARWSLIFHPPLQRLVPGVCALLGALMPLLELVPFSSSLLGATVSVLATATLVHDGVLASLALIPLLLAMSLGLLAL
nr:exopolysaccharide biosynthesis protein [Oceanococcus sp. HetDA_MAG_MS8]